MPRTSQNVVVARPHILLLGDGVSPNLSSRGLYAVEEGS
jgi:hypothetical protein